VARLHLEPDAALARLRDGLRAKGHDVTDHTAAWLAPSERPEGILLKAAAQGRLLFTFRPREYAVLGKRHRRHAGILAAVQHHWSPDELLAALDRALTDADVGSWTGRTMWLDRWRNEGAQP
jgi:hypothetical protein